MQNFLRCTELNNFFPPNSSDDLCLLSCINPSSMLRNLDNFLQYLERNLRAIMNILLWNLCNLLQSYLCSEEHDNFPTASMKNLPIFLSCKKHDYFPTIRVSRRNLPIYLSVINMNIFHQYLWKIGIFTYLSCKKHEYLLISTKSFLNLILSYLWRTCLLSHYWKTFIVSSTEYF